jgi:hypothetical protein
MDGRHLDRSNPRYPHQPTECLKSTITCNGAESPGSASGSHGESASDGCADCVNINEGAQQHSDASCGHARECDGAV